MSEILELEARRKIYDLIIKNPGLHLSKIAEILEMRISLVEYHLIYMERNNIVIPVKETGYTRYYVKDKVGTADKKILSLLRREVPLRIVLFLLKNINAQHKDILNNFDLAPSTISYHLKKLVKNGILSVRTFGEERGYFITNREEIIAIIIQYKPYSLIDGFTDVWQDISVE